jgi:hypothetical protein
VIRPVISTITEYAPSTVTTPVYSQAAPTAPLLAAPLTAAPISAPFGAYPDTSAGAYGSPYYGGLGGPGGGGGAGGLTGYGAPYGGLGGAGGFGDGYGSPYAGAGGVGAFGSGGLAGGAPGSYIK